MIARLDQARVAQLFTKWFPCTELLLCDRASEVIERFCDESPGDRIAVEEIRLLESLSVQVARAFGRPAYAEDLTVYEAALAELAASDDARRDAGRFAARNASLPSLKPSEFASLVPVVGGHVRSLRFGYDAPGIAAAIEYCDRVEPVSHPSPRTVLLVMPANGIRPRILRIGPSVKALLVQCDGCADGSMISHSMGAAGDMDREHLIFDAIVTLLRMDVLTYTEAERSR